MNPVFRFITALLLFNIFFISGGYSQPGTTDQKVDSVLRMMTTEEKIGQLNQYNDDVTATGPLTPDGDKEGQVIRGEVGSILNAKGVSLIRRWQEMAMQSRLRIPLLFGQDVIHGYKTTFPIPLAQSCSWDLPAIEQAERIAATEASAGGLNWTFAPMVDIARDPRWGRVMEGAGEDPYLGACIAAARVRGFQGNQTGDTASLIACAKHYAAYGAAVGGRDYNSVDMSLRQLWETYLPPFKAAAEAGARTFMTSFNDLNGVPATANPYLLSEILKDKWNFKGFVVSDWGAVGELVEHGFAADEKEAAYKAIMAGCDMDMESHCYKNYLLQLIREGEVPMAVIDDAVRRILTIKFELGLFNDPYRFCNEQREQRALYVPAHDAAARDLARKSIVLLKNENNVLPISKNTETIACIGPLMKEVTQNKGFWDVDVPGVDTGFIVSQWQGLLNAFGGRSKLLYARGCAVEGNDRSGFDEALKIARQADVVILSIGERRDMSGEAKSRSSIRIPGVQQELYRALLATGKPVVVLINAGRPLIINEIAKTAPAILYTWWLGSEAGNAIADVVSGDYNPSAKLTLTFPQSEGQIPIYYNHFNTGRPADSDSNRFYSSSYLDLSIYPRYEFGYGLSYTAFTYSRLYLSQKVMHRGETSLVSFTLSNTGKYDGEEIVQLYLRDRVSSLVRPVKELKDFVKIRLRAGESKTVEFKIDADKLAFYNQALEHVAEPGIFDLMIGASSRDIRLSDSFELAD